MQLLAHGNWERFAALQPTIFILDLVPVTVFKGTKNSEHCEKCKNSITGVPAVNTTQITKKEVHVLYLLELHVLLSTSTCTSPKAKLWSWQLNIKQRSQHLPFICCFYEFKQAPWTSIMTISSSNNILYNSWILDCSLSAM